MSCRRCPRYSLPSAGNTRGADALEPLRHARCGAAEPAAQAVVALDDAHRATRPRGRHPEPVVLALDDEHLCRDDLELGQAARSRLGTLTLGRLEGEREAEDTHRTGEMRRAAGDARP